MARLRSPEGPSLIIYIPPEILEKIFQMCAATPLTQGERPNRLAISQWRSIALSNPWIWGRIEVGSPKMAKELLSRSEGAFLDIVCAADTRMIKSFQLRPDIQSSRRPLLLLDIRILIPSVVVKELETIASQIVALYGASCLRNKFVTEIEGSGALYSDGYASPGTNHTLPTNGYARQFSGVNTQSFQERITYQQITQDSLIGLGPVVAALAYNNS
ncbi:hypothetical protein H0H92_012368 [Tricholoma furcatifolium]|nr:hypothetical protein H0H92_012368 [Tricholoma furcatifolium]